MEELEHLPSPLYEAASSLTYFIGDAPSVAVFAVALLLTVPLGVLHSFISSLVLRHLYSLASGLAVLYIAYGPSSLFLIVPGVVMYFAIPIIVRGQNHGALLVSFLAMGCLSSCHIWNMVTKYGLYVTDFTSSMMVLVIKVMCFAYNYEDGKRKEKNLELSAKPHIQAFREERAVHSYPSFIEYCSFIFFYGTCLAGPSFEYVYYKAFQDHSMFQKEGYRRSPSPYFAGMRTFLFSVLCFIVMQLAYFLPLHGFVDHPDFLKYPFVLRVPYATAAVAIYRFKYYFVWYIAETACIMSGFGFNGCARNGDVNTIKWDRHNNSSIAKVELGRTVPELTNNWNKATNHWLKHYVYLRVSAPARFESIFGGQKAFSMFVTRAISAAWHGFYITYYYFFISVILANAVCDVLRSSVDPFIIGENARTSATTRSLYDTFCRAWTVAIVNYFGASFCVMLADSAHAAWNSLYWWGHITCILFLILSHLFSRSKRVDREKAI